MLGLVQNWFGPRCNPIGVDFGSDALRMAQVNSVDNDWKLIAAAHAPIPPEIRQDPAARWSFFTQTAKELLAKGKFRGRHVMLAMPAASVHIQHLRVDRMDAEQLKKVIPWEARGKLPIDPKNAVLRHIIAGEVYDNQEPRQEVIVMGALREVVDNMLAAAAKARLDVVGMNVEPSAILDCFNNVYRREADQETTNLFVDIGSTGSRAMLTRGRQILFARNINIGGDRLNNAVATAMKLSPEMARELRVKFSDCQPSSPTFVAAAADDVLAQRRDIENACTPLLEKLVEELDLCRRYYEATFPNKPVDRMVFIGGEARHRWLCQRIARGLGLAAQLGDPMCRMSRSCLLGTETGIDRRLPQPGWAVAIGLSMGPAAEATQSTSSGENRESKGADNRLIAQETRSSNDRN
jgi:type IV pilus assembly protein PilM